jgi:glycosyltransferase involved in cell wall biosynthesis
VRWWAVSKQDIINFLGVPSEKITVIYEGRNPAYHPIDKAEAQTVCRNNWGLDNDFIFFISTIEPRKNIPTLLRAYRCLRDSYKRKEKLVLAGSKGWLFEEVDQTIHELGLENDVILIGRVQDADVNYLYNAANMLVFPSFYEGFGLPPLEAMACGTPVIVSKIKVMPEIVGDAALLVDPHDVEDLAIAMNRLLTDETLREELIVKGHKRADKFSWEKAARETLDVYHKVGQNK